MATCKSDCKLHIAYLRLLVVAQVSLATLIVIMGERPWHAWWSLTLSVVGLALGGWALVTMGTRQITAMPTPRAGAQLLCHGPYRFVRHPMYTSLILFTLSFVVSRPTRYLVVAESCLVVVLWLKSHEEEKLLRETFAAYGDYARSTKRFVPSIVATGGSHAKRRRNSEQAEDQIE